MKVKEFKVQSLLRFPAMQHSMPVSDSIPVDSIFDLIRLDADSLICSCSGNERICVNRLNKVDWSVAECLELESILELGGKLDRAERLCEAHGAYALCMS